MKLTGWGRYPRIDAKAFFFENSRGLIEALAKDGDVIAHAQGRSYGDSALNESVILTGRFDKMLDFDPREGVLTCECGVTLAEILQVFVPRGWFLSVTPGTRLISVGGAIASDVHGKNHHRVGCFSECVVSFDLMLPNGDIVCCSREENRELFHATCGGMGLTGMVLNVSFRLQPIKSAYIRETVIRCRNLEEVFNLLDHHDSASYSVAWIDCLAKGDLLGRSVLMLGEHADSGSLALAHEKSFNIPFDLPSSLLNKYSISLFNHIYYQARPEFMEGRLTPFEAFFYPLDKIEHWNRMYGRQGFTQYQLVVPKEAGFEGIRAILIKAAQAGLGSFLGVLKLFGPANENALSFPMEGYTLALDLKICKGLFRHMDELDRLVLDYGGRLYLAKDVRMSREVFRKSYHAWERFAALRERYGMKLKFNSLQSRRLGV